MCNKFWGFVYVSSSNNRQIAKERNFDYNKQTGDALKVFDELQTTAENLENDWGSKHALVFEIMLLWKTSW